MCSPFHLLSTAGLHSRRPSVALKPITLCLRQVHVLSDFQKKGKKKEKGKKQKEKKRKKRKKKGKKEKKGKKGGKKEKKKKLPLTKETITNTRPHVATRDYLPKVR